MVMNSVSDPVGVAMTTSSVYDRLGYKRNSHRPTMSILLGLNVTVDSEECSILKRTPLNRFPENLTSLFQSPYEDSCSSLYLEFITGSGVCDSCLPSNLYRRQSNSHARTVKLTFDQTKLIHSDYAGDVMLLNEDPYKL